MFLRKNLLLLLLFGIIGLTTYGQRDHITQKINSWYLDERFLIADLNDDALLDQTELANFRTEFSYYLENRNYLLTDTNRDGMLSFREINARVQSEILYRYNMERREIRNLAREYPMLFQADERYLKGNSQLVYKLFGNLTWMYENDELAEKIYSDRAWMARNPGATVALHRNLRWMAANPVDANNLYADRRVTQQLPELLGWRADHKDFIRRNITADKFYELFFIPEGIRRR